MKDCRNIPCNLDVVENVYNSSYLGGRVRTINILRSARAKVGRPVSKTKF
jgi:hypothetical protein